MPAGAREKVIRLLGQSEFGVGEISLVLPTGRIINQVGKRHMPSTFRQIDVAGPQAIADGHGETEFPGPTIDGCPLGARPCETSQGQTPWGPEGGRVLRVPLSSCWTRSSPLRIASLPGSLWKGKVKNAGKYRLRPG